MSKQRKKFKISPIYFVTEEKKIKILSNSTEKKTIDTPSLWLQMQIESSEAFLNQ